MGASYGFGETAGSMTRNQYWGTRASYDIGPSGIGAVYQEFRNATSERQQMWGVAGKYTLGAAKLFLGYVGGRDATGTIDNGFLNRSAATTTAAAQASIASGAANTPRKDMIGYVGMTYQVTPALAVTGVFYGDHVKDKNATDNSGNPLHRCAAGRVLAVQAYPGVRHGRLQQGHRFRAVGNARQEQPDGRGRRYPPHLLDCWSDGIAERHLRVPFVCQGATAIPRSCARRAG